MHNPIERGTVPDSRSGIIRTGFVAVMITSAPFAWKEKSNAGLPGFSAGTASARQTADRADDAVFLRRRPLSILKFLRFRRLPDDAQKPADGGLGLAFMQTVTRRHGGRAHDSRSAFR